MSSTIDYLSVRSANCLVPPRPTPGNGSKRANTNRCEYYCLSKLNTRRLRKYNSDAITCRCRAGIDSTQNRFMFYTYYFTPLIHIFGKNDFSIFNSFQNSYPGSDSFHLIIDQFLYLLRVGFS